MYICGRDKCYRPIICVRPKIIMDMSPVPATEEVIAAQVQVICYALDYMMIDGVIENFNLILDMKDLGAFSINYNLMKSVLAYSASAMKGRARGVFVMNAPKTFSVIWKVVRYFLDDNTANKFQITSSPTNPALLDLIHPD